jgi:hypothetical protein
MRTTKRTAFVRCRIIAWTARNGVDLVLYMLAARAGLPGALPVLNALSRGLGLALAALVLVALPLGLPYRLAAMTVVAVVFCGVAWTRLLDREERDALLGRLAVRTGGIRPAQQSTS